MASTGRVSSWLPDDGWGVIESPETPGGCWMHFSTLDMLGYRALKSEQVVDFEWEQVEQDGYAYRATWARPHIHS